MKKSPLKVLFLPFFLLSSAAMISGCNSASKDLTVDVIYQSNICNIKREGIVVLATAEKLNKVMSSNNRFDLGGGKADADTAKAKQETLPNFDKKHVLAVSMGFKSTAGYSLVLSDTHVILEDKVAQLAVETQSPDTSGKTGTALAQMLTSPCLILALDKGHYTSIKAGAYTLELSETPIN